jgi:hypothetical protein
MFGFLSPPLIVDCESSFHTRTPENEIACQTTVGPTWKDTYVLLTLVDRTYSSTGVVKRVVLMMELSYFVPCPPSPPFERQTLIPATG